MSRIDELLRELAPEGVTFRSIGDIANVGTGSSDRNQASADGVYPFYVRSQQILRINTYEFDETAIVIPGEGGIGEIFHYVNGKYALHQRAYRIAFNAPEVDTKFAFYFFGTYFKRFILLKAVSATVTSIRKPMITEFRIPVPPLEVQRAIVRILDDFTELEGELEAELEAELKARSTQYAFDRQSLLAFESRDYEFRRLGDIAVVRTGQAPSEGVVDAEGPYRFVNAGTTESGRALLFNTDGDAITIPSRGQGGVGIVGYQTSAFWCGPLCYRIKSSSDGVLTRFLYHYLKSIQPAIRGLQQSGGTPALNRKELILVDVPVPPLDTQQHIVGILDKFDVLVNDLSIALPAELEARRQQYEYYRNKMLTFKEAAR